MKPRPARGTLAILALTAVLLPQAGFTGSRPIARRSDLARSASEAPATSWQRRLDKALLDVDAAPETRNRNLRKALADPGAILQDLSRAASALAQRGFKDGHVEAIDALWPEGTQARRDLRALQALRKQVPEALEELQGRTTSSDSGTPRPLSPGDVASGLLQLATDAEKRREVLEEAKNVLREKPTGLETPGYEVLRSLELPGGELELRRYEAFAVARRGMAEGSGFASAEGFTSLAGYLFGNNSQAVAMEMTSPVEISYGNGSAMSFVLPKAYEREPPVPEEEGIEIVQVPERLVVAKPFPGIATQGEVFRQRTLVSEALAANWTDLRQLSGEDYSLLQYNPPYTLPWRRSNEVAVVVEAAPNATQASAPAEGEDVGEGAEPQEEPSSPAEEQARGTA